MSPLPSFARHTVTVTEPGRRTVHGAEVLDWSPAKVTVRDVVGCLVQPATTDDGQDPDTTRDAWTVKIPGHLSPPSAIAKIRHQFNGTDYQIQGQPFPQPGRRRGSIDHWFLTIEKWVTNG